MTRQKAERTQVRATRGQAETQTAKSKGKAKRLRAPRGQVGPQTYDQVRKLVDEKKIPMGKAFAEVAKATGRQPGTVAVTYYRIARLKGGPTRKKRDGKAGGRPVGRPPGKRPAGKGAGVGAVLSRVSAAIKELETVIAHQAKEITRLRGESGLADRIRKALRD